MSHSTNSDHERSDYLMSLGKQIIELRRKNKMSRAKLSKLSQIHTQYILDIEMGYKNPSIYVLAKIARAFKIPVSQLLESQNLKPIK